MGQKQSFDYSLPTFDVAPAADKAHGHTDHLKPVHKELDAAPKSPAKPGRVAEVDNFWADTHKIAQTSHQIDELAQQTTINKDQINAKRKELAAELTQATADADKLPADRIQKRLDAVQSDIVAKGGKDMTPDDRMRLIQTSPDQVPANKMDLYNALHEEFALKSAKIAPEVLRGLHAKEALAGHTDPSAPIADHGPTKLTPSAQEILDAKKLTSGVARANPEAEQALKVLSGQANVEFTKLQKQGPQDQSTDHAIAANGALSQANAFNSNPANRAANTDKAAKLFQQANAEVDQINFGQIKDELKKGATPERAEALNRTLHTANQARLDYAKFLVDQGKPMEAQVYLKKAVTDGTEPAEPNAQSQSYQAIMRAAKAPPADQKLIDQEQALTLNLGTTLNDPKTAAQIVPKVLDTLTRQTSDITTSQQDVQKELQAANLKLKTGGLSASETTRVQNEVKSLQDEQNVLAANLGQRKQELANTQYKAALLSMAKEDPKTAATMLSAAKENDPHLFDWIKAQGGKGEETFNELMAKTKDKSFWQKNWSWITSLGTAAAGAGIVLGVAALVATAPITVTALAIGGAVAGTIALGAAARYYLKGTTGEKATWKDAVQGGLEGGLSACMFLRGTAAVAQLAMAAREIPLVARAALAVADVAAAAKVTTLSPAYKFIQPAVSTVTEYGSKIISPIERAGSYLYDKAPAGARLAVDFAAKYGPGKVSWGVGATYGSYKFHHDVANGESVGKAALMFVPHMVEGAVVTQGFRTGTGAIGDALASTKFARVGQVMTEASALPARLLPTSKTAWGVGMTYASVKAGMQINRGESLGQAAFNAPFDMLEGAQFGQFAGGMGKGRFVSDMATTVGKTAAASYGISAANHFTLYKMGQETSREAFGNFLTQGPMLNAGFKVYQGAYESGVQAISKATTPSWLTPSGAAYVKSAGLFTAVDGGSSTYNSVGPRISIPHVMDLRPTNNPNVPLDLNRPNEEQQVKWNMLNYQFDDIDTPRPLDGQFPQNDQ